MLAASSACYVNALAAVRLAKPREASSSERCRQAAEQYKRSKLQPWRSCIESFTLMELIGDP